MLSIDEDTNSDFRTCFVTGWMMVSESLADVFALHTLIVDIGYRRTRLHRRLRGLIAAEHVDWVAFDNFGFMTGISGLAHRNIVFDLERSAVDNGELLCFSGFSISDLVPSPRQILLFVFYGTFTRPVRHVPKPTDRRSGNENTCDLKCDRDDEQQFRAKPLQGGITTIFILPPQCTRPITRNILRLANLQIALVTGALTEDITSPTT
ncbi:hypothetical protein ARMSODRAFT_1028467 [Armillaria solidipes]|uniref:Uncharacterized protein n=1 Tax=Armillaria solidipes TaxID=1076256 RepID=A0A2H3B0N8_9AGAR|nr:hypothetical protein ARMSODRAFT_1028467 [Armillaria solidipes]